MSDFNTVKNNLMLMRDFSIEEEKLQGVCNETIQYIENLEAKVKALESPVNMEELKKRTDFIELEPLERLRFFCSMCMNGEDWLSVGELFEDIEKDDSYR